MPTSPELVCLVFTSFMGTRTMQNSAPLFSFTTIVISETLPTHPPPCVWGSPRPTVSLSFSPLPLLWACCRAKQCVEGWKPIFSLAN